jgi:Flp pilus assembly pilin Flp
MVKLIQKLWTDEQGQDLAEYGIALAVIGALAAAVVTVIATNVNTLWSRANSVIADAAQ